MRFVSVSVLAALAAAGYSSFDLVLIADNSGGNTGPVPMRIHRYDGDSGAYLGSINAGFAGIMDMAVNPAAGELYALTNSQLLVLDYNRGGVTRQFSGLGFGTLKFQNNKLYRAVGTTLSEVNTATGGLTTVKTWTQNITDFVVTPGGGYAFYNSSTANVQGFSSAGVGGAIATVTNVNNGKVSGDGLTPNRFYVLGNLGTTTTASFTSYTMDAAGGLTSGGPANYSANFMTSPVDITKSHIGAWIYGRNQAGNPMMYRMFSGITTGDTAFITPQVTTAGPIAVVLAPEPGTMIALGAGALALLRRRKK